MKKEKPILHKKLKAYSALAGSVIAVGSIADAQVVYTDVTPDTTFTNNGDFYNLDLDNNSSVDFKLLLTRLNNATTSGTSYINLVEVDPVSLNAAVGTSSTNIPLKLYLNNSIGSSLSWNPGGATTLPLGRTSSGTSTSGSWLGAQDKYLPLRFEISGQTHYGWVRLDVDANAKSFTVKDYAYNTTPNQKILAGQTVVGINKVLSEKGINIHAYEKDIYLTLHKELNPEGTIIITNNLGQIIYKAKVTGAVTKISLGEEFKTGVYFVNINLQEGVNITRKVYIQ